MAVTKTDFINYTRCKRYVNLENIRKDKLNSHLSIEEYKSIEYDEKIDELLSCMFDDEDNDLTVKENKQLEAMMDYYKEVEILSGAHVNKLFGGTSVYSEDTYSQESFDCEINGIRYLCYTDIYNESEGEINIIEVKATTSRRMLELAYGKEKYPLFVFENGIYKIGLCKDNEYLSEYEKKINSLRDRYKKGKYIYDLAVQRYIIDRDLKSHNVNKKVNYYLAVLNHEYVYDGYMENGKKIYRKDENGNELISIFDMNDITLSMMDLIDNDRKNLEEYIFNGSSSPCKVGVSCALKKTTECKFKDICFKDVPHTNASYNYKRFLSFRDEYGTSYNKYDLINERYYKLNDIPASWLKSENHIIQRNCYETGEVHINKEKIKLGLDTIKYPIYHLDFETFPCPVPRFRGETPYTQSPFEFSLHIEKTPGVCDKEKDNFVFLADTLEDERLELVKALVERIDGNNGTMLAQNVTFERNVIKHMAEIFPEYKDRLLCIKENSTDLLYYLDTNKEFYMSHGYSEIDAKTMNYYNSKQSGSFSIKKTLPIFTSLSYKDLEVQNGNEALSVYASYDKMSESELKEAKLNLIEYCKQDTWAMVEILNGLRKLVE